MHTGQLSISSVHEKVDGYEVGQHPLVSRLLKGAFNQRPPQPRYTYTWNVERVTTYIESIGDNEGLSTTVLTSYVDVSGKTSQISRLDWTGPKV